MERTKSRSEAAKLIPMDAGNGKSRDFRLSQALANQVVQKGLCGDLVLCGLSPPVSHRQEMASRYTFLNGDEVMTLFVFGAIADAGESELGTQKRPELLVASSKSLQVGFQRFGGGDRHRPVPLDSRGTAVFQRHPYLRNVGCQDATEIFL